MTPDQEKAWLGRCLAIGHHDCDWMGSAPKEEAFRIAAHRKIYRAICKLMRHGEPIDVVTVALELKKQGSCIAPDYLTELTICLDGNKA